MMAVLWRVIETETNNAEHPGKIADYVGAVNFDVDVRSDPSGQDFTIVVEAKSKFDA